MASELKHTVMPSGGDFSTLGAAVDHLEASHSNLVTADVYASIEIDGTWSSPDTSTVTIHNITTDSTHYIDIYTTAAARHDGKWKSGAYRYERSGSGISGSACNDWRLRGVQIQITSSSNWSFAVGNPSTAAATTTFRMSHCIVKFVLSGTADNIYGVRSTTAASGTFTCDIFNNIFYDILNGSYSNIRAIRCDTPHTVNAYNNTIHNCYIGIQRAGGTCKAINNLTQACTDGFSGTFDGASDYNLSDIASDAPGSHSRNGQDVTFVDEANDDFHLASGDTGAKDYGTSDPGSGLFSDDIDGETRSGTWDIGADEYVSSGYSLSCDGGSFALTGQDAGVYYGRAIDADAGAYVLTGADVAALFGRRVSAEAGVYQLTGQDAALLRAARIAAEAGVYALIGQDVGLIYVPGGGAYVLTADGGTYGVTGADVGLRRAGLISAEPGAYVLTGMDAATLIGRLIDAGAGVYALTGADAALLRAAKVTAEAGAYIVTGSDAALSLAAQLAEAILNMLRPAQRIVLSPAVPRIVNATPAQRIVLTDRSDA